MIAGKLFVTPHAVRSFQKRIHDIEYNQALSEIIKGINAPTDIRISENKASVCYHVKGRYWFRAVVKENLVVTILRKGHKKYVKNMHY